MELRKNLILRRPQSGRLEGRTRVIQLESDRIDIGARRPNTLRHFVAAGWGKT